MRRKRSIALCFISLFIFFSAAQAAAAPQSPAANARASAAGSEREANEKSRKDKKENREEKTTASLTVEERLRAMEEIIERQQREIESLREMITSRSEQSVAARPPEPDRPIEDHPRPAVASAQANASGKNEQEQAVSTQQKIDELYRRFGALQISGDIRFRAETFRNQGFDSLTEAPARNRLRVRARLALDGTINKNFDWGLRLATGIFTDPISTNQTLTDFFERKPFSLDRAFIRYDSKTDALGVQLVAGKFEPTFRRTQMVWDDDVNVEGASEALYFKTDSSLSQIKLVAFQLPFDEQSGAKDAVLYGGQLQTDWKFASNLSANFNLAYYDWVRADRVLRALDASPTQVNGGISLGTTNRVIRDADGTPVGFLANFNLLDFLANLTWQARPRIPVTFTLDFVRNLSDRIDDEKNGYWFGVQAGQTREQGDWMAGYTYTRIEQDAVLVPFNFSDILPSNSRNHVPTAAYQLANNVTLQWTGLFSQRANRVVALSPFNRWLNRMEFDVIYRF